MRIIATPPAGAPERPVPGADELSALQKHLAALREEIHLWRESWRREVDQRLDQMREEVKQEAQSSAQVMRQELESLSRDLAGRPAAEAASPEEIRRAVEDLYQRELTALDERLKAQFSATEARLDEQSAEIRRMAGRIAESIAREEETVPPPPEAAPSPSPEELPPAAVAEPEPPPPEPAGERVWQDSEAQRQQGLLSQLWTYLNEPALHVPIGRARPKDGTAGPGSEP